MTIKKYSVLFVMFLAIMIISDEKPFDFKQAAIGIVYAIAFLACTVFVDGMFTKTDSKNR